jgi:pyridoxal 5'-phosphate synthase pdxT subunit
VTIGVLALQGDFAEHRAVLKSIGVESKEVRSVSDFSGINGLIIPGGESTVLSKLLTSTGLREGIRQSSIPILGTCAGAILLATEVQDGNGVEPLGLIDMTIQRNAYGQQQQSERRTIVIHGASVPVAFIRAPRIVGVGVGVGVVAECDGVPVFVRQGNKIATTFHTEVTGSTVLHLQLVELIVKTEDI